MPANLSLYRSAAPSGVWTALNGQYRKNGSFACRSMNATPSRANASVRYSFSCTSCRPRRMEANPVPDFT